MNTMMMNKKNQNPMMQDSPMPEEQGMNGASGASGGARDNDEMEDQGGGAVGGYGDPKIQRELFARIDTLSQQEMQVLDSMITIQTLPVWVKIAPELAPLLQMASEIQAYDQRLMQSGAGQGNMGGMQGGMPQQQGPTNQQGASRGLIGG